MHLQETKEFADFRGQEWFQSLQKKFNIRHVEQFAALLGTPDGETALRRLHVPVDAVKDPTDRYLTAVLGVSLKDFGQPGQPKGDPVVTTASPQELRLSFGLDKQRDQFSKLVFGSVLPPVDKKNGPERSGRNGFFPPFSPGDDEGAAGDDLPREAFVVSLPPQLPAAGDQEQRGTCVGFTVCAMWELMHRRLHPSQDDLALSPQFAFYCAKEVDGRERQDGTTLGVALTQMAARGICKSALCPYHGYHDFGQSYTFEKDGLLNLKKVEQEAAKRRITGATRLASANVDAIKRTIVSGRPVGLGIPIFRNAWLGGFSQLRGEVTLPLTEDTDGTERVLDSHEGSHAVCIVGYRDNDPAPSTSDRPGGGYFVFKNSWGKVWAQAPTEKHVVPGYGILPYAYVARYWLDAYVIDGLLIDGTDPTAEQPAKSTRKPKPKTPPRTPRRAKKTAN